MEKLKVILPAAVAVLVGAGAVVLGLNLKNKNF
jgi:hypothetical protein